MYGLYYVEVCSLYTHFLESFYHKCVLNFVESFFLHLMEKAVAPHSSPLAWKIPWMEEPGGLQSMGLLGVGND